MEWFLKSLGVSSEVIEHLDHAALAFQRPAVLWGGLLLLIPAGYYIYRRQAENLSTVPQKIRITLTATRVFILFVLVAILAGPYLKVDLQTIHKPIVAVLLDTSHSMQLPAGPYASAEQLQQVASAVGTETKNSQVKPADERKLSQLSRRELAEQAISHAEKLFQETLPADYEVQFYTFAQQALPHTLEFGNTNSPAESALAATSSHIGNAILKVVDEAAGQQVAGILLFSDGQNTGGPSLAMAARTAAENQAPVFSIPVGPAQPVKDVSIVDVYTSGLVAVGDTVRVHVTLESQGFDDRPVKLELKAGESLLDQQELVLNGSTQQQVEFTFEAKEPGARYLTITIPPFAEESEQLRSNNSDTAFVRISEEKLRVLFVDGLPRWDFRFLKNAIRRDHGLAGRTADAPDIILETEWRRLPDAQKLAALPQTLDQLKQYHTIVLGDASAELLNSPFRNSLIAAVQEAGVGLIIAAGPQAMPHQYDEAFQSLLPVRFDSERAGTEAPAHKPFRIKLSPTGLVHETMRLYDDAYRNNSIWEQMPPFYWAAASERPSAAATVLAWNAGLENRFGYSPLIAHHFAGAGKVMFVGTDSTWLWRQNVGDRYFYKFWGQAIRFVARRDESAKKSWIAVQPVRAQQGEETRLELMAYLADGAPAIAPKQQITILGPETRNTVDVLVDPAKPGRYTGKFTPTESGVHRLTYQAAAESQSAEALMRVLQSPEELRHPNLNRPALERLASATGGDTIEVSELMSLPERLGGDKELRELHREASIWDNWLTLLLVMLTYSVDVGIRRLMGLS